MSELFTATVLPRPGARREAVMAVTQAIADLAERLAGYVETALAQGMLAPALDSLLEEYANFLRVALENLTNDQEATFQRPSANIVTTSLKANLPVRIACRLPSWNDSMTILDTTGAENLLGRGDMLLRTNISLERLQGYYIESTDLDRFIRKHRSR